MSYQFSCPLLVSNEELNCRAHGGWDYWAEPLKPQETSNSSAGTNRVAETEAGQTCSCLPAQYNNTARPWKSHPWLHTEGFLALQTYGKPKSPTAVRQEPGWEPQSRGKGDALRWILDAVKRLIRNPLQRAPHPPRRRQSSPAGAPVCLLRRPVHSGIPFASLYLAASSDLRSTPCVIKKASGNKCIEVSAWVRTPLDWAVSVPMLLSVCAQSPVWQITHIQLFHLHFFSDTQWHCGLHSCYFTQSCCEPISAYLHSCYVTQSQRLNSAHVHLLYWGFCQKQRRC